MNAVVPSPKEEALAALARSRAALLAEMKPPTDGSDGPPLLPGQLRAWWAQWQHKLKHDPAYALGLSALQEWWRASHWHAIVRGIRRESQALVAPLVKRHPVVAAALALLAGAALGWAQPWRSEKVTGAVRRARTRTIPWLVRRAMRAPLKAVLTALLGTLAAASAPAAAKAAMDAATGDPAGTDAGTEEPAAAAESTGPLDEESGLNPERSMP